MAKKKAAVVLLSSGLDSTFNLVEAFQSLEVRLVLTFDYGQKAAVREIERARALVQRYSQTHTSLKHHIVKLPWFADFTRTSLIAQGDVPSGADVGIDDMDLSRATAKRVWVPNRNGIFLSIAAGFAEGLDAQYVIPGFNREEAQTFPDNTGEFLTTLDYSWEYSTSNKVKTFCFSTNLDKTEIVALGLKSGVPFEMLWPCYLAGSKWCGRCESCQRYSRALKANGLSFDELNKEDPA